MAISDSITYRLKPEAGDASPHNEIGGGHILSGGTVTLLDRGGGDWAWQFTGRSTTTVPSKVFSPSSAAGGFTIAVRFKLVTYPAADFGTFLEFINSNGGEPAYLRTQRIGAAALRHRIAISGGTNLDISGIGSTEAVHVLRIKTNGASTETFDRWMTKVSRTGSSPDGTASIGLIGQTFDTLNLGLSDGVAVVQVSDYVIFDAELSDADCTALADNGIRATLDAGGGDTTAPTLTSPTGTATGPTTASGSVSTDEDNGTLYAVVSVSATKPTPTQMQAGQSATGGAAAYATNKAVTATGVQSVAATGLTAGTTYYWHYQHKDAAGNNSAVVTSASFTTSAANAPPTFTGPNIGAQSGTVGTALSALNVAGRFSDTDALTFSAVGTWPAGVAVSSVGVISGTPTTAGTYSALKVRATDTASQTADSDAFTFTIAATADTTVPTLTGAISVTSKTTTSYTLTWPAGSDNVAVTGYEYSLDGGMTYLDAGNVLTKNITGRTPGATDSVRVRAYDAAGNKSTPSLSTSVTLDSPPLASVTTPTPLKNNTTAVQASRGGIAVTVIRVSPFGPVATKTGLSTGADGRLTVSDAALVAGTAYVLAMVDPVTGAVGITNPVTAV